MIKVNGEVVNIERFPDGTPRINISEGVTEHTFITWLYETNDELMYLYMIKRHLDQFDGVSVYLKVPYVLNGRMDRVKNIDEVFTLKYFCEIINSLNFKKVYTLDNHSDVSTALLNNCKNDNPKDYIKKAMSKLVNAKEPKYDFRVGDYVEDIDGNVGYIDFICDCDKCRERGFNEPRICYKSGETDYITVHQLDNLEKSYRRIGKYEFSKKHPIVKSIDSIIVTGTTEEGESFAMTFSDFDKDNAEIKSSNDNGKKALSLTIHGGYNVKVEY